ncbi:estrogen-related receptor gamma-like [Glandiceps talaboti]
MADMSIAIKQEYPTSPDSESYSDDLDVFNRSKELFCGEDTDRKLHNLGQRSPETALTAEKGAFCQLESQKQNFLEQFCTSSVAAESRNEESHGRSKNNQKLCLVCGDVASGYHYGVASCEACKAFFKRTVQGNVQYVCPAVNECDITKRRRKSCQACRYRKCLIMGMLKEGVRIDRVRGGRQKYHILHRASENTEQEPVKKKVKAEHAIVTQLMAAEPEKANAMPEDIPDVNDAEVKIWMIMSNLANKELVGLITWAKQIPGFLSLALNDQMTLLQSAWNEILCLGLAYRSVPYKDKLVFADDFILEKNGANIAGLRLDLLNEMTLRLTEKLQMVKIDREEYVLLKALVLCNSDIVHLEDAAAVDKIQDTLFDALNNHIQAIHPSEKRRQSQLLMGLPLLRQLSAASMQHIREMSQHKEIPMDQLLKEMISAKMDKDAIPIKQPQSNEL